MKQLTQRQVMEQHPVAYAALPEAYQADSCLEFWAEESELFAAPKESEIRILGDWIVKFNGSEWITWG